MKSAKERLHDEYFDGIPAPQPGQDVPDYSHGLKALAEAFDTFRAVMNDRINDLVERQKEKASVEWVTSEIAGVEERVNAIQDMDSIQAMAEESDDRDLVFSWLEDRFEEMAEEQEALKGHRRRNTHRIGEIEEAVSRLQDRIESITLPIGGEAEATRRREFENEELDERLKSIRREQRRLADTQNELASLVENLESRMDAESGDLGPIGKELGRLSRAQEKLVSLVQELESRLEDVEEGMDFQDAHRGSLGRKVGRLHRRVLRLEQGREPAFRDSSQRDSSQRDSSQKEEGDAGGPPQPCWHDHPPEPGVYVQAYEHGEPVVVRVTAPAAYGTGESERFYGPIPEKEGTGLETHV
jgi:chromosome segregation ATPase